MRHRQKIIDHYSADTDLRVLAVSFRCSPHEYELLSRAAEQCSKRLGAYVRDEVVSLHQDAASRPRSEDLHTQLAESLHVLSVRLNRVHVDLRMDYMNRRPLSDISAAEIYEVAERCRFVLSSVATTLARVPADTPPPGTAVDGAERPMRVSEAGSGELLPMSTSVSCAPSSASPPSSLSPPSTLDAATRAETGDDHRDAP